MKLPGLAVTRRQSYSAIMSTQPYPPDEKIPQWVWLVLGGLGSLLLVGGAVGWIVRGQAMLVDMADFFCF